MKKRILIAVLFSTSAVVAQTYSRYGNSNEVKFNIGLFLATTAVEGSYEHYLSEDTSIGGDRLF